MQKKTTNNKESDIQSLIINYLEFNGVYVVRTNSGATFKTYKTKSGEIRKYKIKGAEEGTPDLICCINGRFVGIEVKSSEEEIEKWKKYYSGYTERGARSKNYRRAYMQNEAIKKIEAAGGRSFIISSLEDVDSILTIIKGH